MSEATDAGRLVARTARAVLEGSTLLDGVRPGWCLMGVRLVVEHALKLPAGGFYTAYGAARTERSAGRVDWSWWAADIEASMKRLGLAVPFAARQPGDLVFSYELAAPIGHVAVLASDGAMLEITDPRRRPTAFARGSVCLTPWGTWTPTLVARLPDRR